MLQVAAHLLEGFKDEARSLNSRTGSRLVRVRDKTKLLVVV